MKDFLLIGNKNCISHKDFFKLMMDRKVNIGYTRPGDFGQPDGTLFKKLKGLTRWFSTLSVSDKPALTLTATYDPELYPKYDNYDAINVDRVQDIPYDYDGVMGCPITIFDHNVDYEYDGCLYGDHTIIDGKYIKGHTPIVDGKHLYTRILIRRNRFEIVDARDYTNDARLKKKGTPLIKDGDGTIKGKTKYCRVLIRRKIN